MVPSRMLLEANAQPEVLNGGCREAAWLQLSTHVPLSICFFLESMGDLSPLQSFYLYIAGTGLVERKGCPPASLARLRIGHQHFQTLLFEFTPY